MVPGNTQLTDKIVIEEPQEVFEEVLRILLLMRPGFDVTLVSRSYRDIERLFRGDYPGYRKCNTAYHDLRHTMSVVLAMTRLMDGSTLEGRQISEKGINIGLISALMHDTGYIQLRDDREGTGAKYTMVHISRSVDFMRRYFTGNDYLRDHIPLFANILNCTGVSVKVNEIRFASPEQELLGKMLGTADLLGQMADRLYLEKLVFLFHEFDEARMKGFDSELDLLRKTIDFYDSTKARFATELGGVDRFMLTYFQKRLNIGLDLYKERIENNIGYLKDVLDNHEKNYADYLRRTSSIEGPDS
jgi:hypothetical protein